MPLADLKTKYKKSDLWRSPPKNEWKVNVNEYLGSGHEPHSNYFFGFLGLIYDGINTLKMLKSQMRLFFISSTKQLVIEETDVEEYLQVAKKKRLISMNQDGTITLTEEGKKFTELCYYMNLHTSYWMRIFFSKYSVMVITTFCLIILSSLKIFTGFQLGSQGMLSEGFENLTDLIKIGIIGLIGFKYKKDKVASVIITIMMLFTGTLLIWSSTNNF